MASIAFSKKRRGRWALLGNVRLSLLMKSLALKPEGPFHWGLPAAPKKG